MTDTLKDLIVRDSIAGRIFVIEKDPTPKPGPLTLRRLDREVREQAHVYRTRAEVLGMTVLEPRGSAFQGLQEAAKGVLSAWDGYLATQPDARPDAFLGMVRSMATLGELVEQ